MFDNNMDDFSRKWNVPPSCGLHPSGRADNDQWHGEPSECHLPGHGARQLDQAGVPLHVWPGPVVHWPAGQDQGAGKLVSGLRLALCSVAGWLLQPTVLPHSHHADYGSKVGMVGVHYNMRAGMGSRERGFTQCVWMAGTSGPWTACLCSVTSPRRTARTSVFHHVKGPTYMGCTWRVHAGTHRYMSHLFFYLADFIQK